MWKEFDLPVVNNPAVGPVTEVSPAAAAAVEAIAPVTDTHVNGESGGSDQAEDTHDSMQEVQEEEPEPQEGTTQAHVNESDHPELYPNGPRTLKRTYFWKVKTRPRKIANKTLGPGKHLHWFGFWFQSPDGNVVKTTAWLKRTAKRGIPGTQTSMMMLMMMMSERLYSLSTFQQQAILFCTTQASFRGFFFPSLACTRFFTRRKSARLPDPIDASLAPHSRHDTTRNSPLPGEAIVCEEVEQPKPSWCLEGKGCKVGREVDSPDMLKCPLVYHTFTLCASAYPFPTRPNTRKCGRASHATNALACPRIPPCGTGCSSVTVTPRTCGKGSKCEVMRS